MKNKLLIWDFDGVIADTEIIWLTVRMNAINEKFHTNFDIFTFFNLFGGTNDKTKQVILEKMGYKTDQKFWDDVYAKDIEYIKINHIKTTPDVEQVFEINKFSQCIATSGRKVKTDIKIKYCGISKYFSDDIIFTSDDVKEAKPCPDLFLYAAKKMGYEPKDCIVIEDSINGMIAGKNAGMKVLAFIGNGIYINEKYLSSVKNIGVENVFFNMSDIKKYLEEYKDE